MEFLKNWKKVVCDARFWIAFFAVVRLYGITDPPLEVVHNWRQSTVAMVARNFYETSPELLYPRLDIDGNGTGIEGMEFPVLNYCIFLVAEVFGYDHWYGRLINLVVSSFGIWCLFLLLRNYATERLALMAVIILEVSMWFVYMRKMMPDTFSVSLVLCGMYFAIGYLLEKKNGWWLVASLLLILLGTLSKIPAACLLPALFLPFFKSTLNRKIVFAIAGAVAMAPVFWWYFSWVPYLNAHFGTGHFFMGQSFSEGFKSIAHEPGNLFYYF
ncbi:MAG: ArnT family glycosyltransferase, partial [Flavobacteriales bacterium]